MEGLKTAVSAYETVQVDAAVLGATPHELIAKLLSKAIDSIIEAKGMIEKGEIALKGELIKLAITIISDGLRSSLNMEAGGEIAANLDSLYEYMSQRLLKAHIDNDTEVLDEVVGLLNDIKAGWDGIKGQV